MKLVETMNLDTEQKRAICAIWNREYPEPVSYKSLEGFENYLSTLARPRHLLLQEDKEALMGWACSFTRDDERWFVILLHQDIQGQGKGTLLLNQLKDTEEQLCGWVIDHDRAIKQNGEQYRSPLAFYLKNGFTVCPDTRLELPIMSAVKIQWVRPGQ